MIPRGHWTAVPSYLGLINHPYLFPIYTHTYKPHTHRPVAKSWFALLSFLSVLPVFTFLLSDLGLFTRYSDRLLPAQTWIVFIGLWLFASCPDLSPSVQLCLCLASTVLPCWCLALYCLTILNKMSNGSKLLWLFVTVAMCSIICNSLKNYIILFGQNIYFILLTKYCICIFFAMRSDNV